jgi:PTH1 family peptidyl-tRNA hydrolase
MDRNWLLIVGLGNPGRKYAGNRHNVGFHCLDLLAKKHGLVFDKKQGKAKLALGQLVDRRVILAKPQTLRSGTILQGGALGSVGRL